MDGAAETPLTSTTSRAAEVSLAGSFASNLGGVGWMALMQFAFTPLFLRVLAAEGYGVIGFGLTVMALVQVLDFGFAPTINRWLSRHAAGHEDAQNARDLARTLEVGSWLIAAGAGFLLALLAGPIGRAWLQNARLGDAVLQQSILLMAVMIAAQLPITYYQSALLGLRRPHSVNVLRATAATLAMGGAAFVLTRVTPTVPAYFAVQAAVACVHVVVLRFLLWRSLPGDGAHFRLSVLNTAWRFTAGMTGIAIGGAVAAQMDRLIVVRMVPLEEFGRYALAWTVASALSVISLPAMHTLFPRLSGMVASGDRDRLRAGFHAGAQALSVLLLPAAVVIALFARPLLEAWTADPAIARMAAPIATFLVIGMALNGVMHSIYALQLAAGATRLAFRLTMLQIATIIPLVAILAWRYGALGAAAAWALMNVVYFLAGSLATFRSVMAGGWTRWLVGDVVAPLLAALAVVGAAWAFLPIPSSRAGAIAAIAAVFLAAVIAAGLVARTTREAVRARL